MKITVDRPGAESLLSINYDNRDLDVRKVNYYAVQMNRNLWYLGGSAIEVKAGTLVNGQHRLAAFLRSDLKEITFLFKVG